MKIKLYQVEMIIKLKYGCKNHYWFLKRHNGNVIKHYKNIKKMFIV